MITKKFRWILPFSMSMFAIMACGQMAVRLVTPTPANLVAVGQPAGFETPHSENGADELVVGENPSIPTETPITAPSPTSEWSQYWVEVQDPYHNVRFAMPCSWLAQFPLEDLSGDGAFVYPVKNYPDDYVFNFPRSNIPPEAGAIKIDMNFMSAAGMRNLPPGTSQLDFVNQLYGSDSEELLISTQEVEINGQPVLFVTTQSNFGIGNFYLFTVTDDLFLAFATASERMADPDVQGILNSIAVSTWTEVQVPDFKPGPPPVGLAAPCIPGYEQAVVPTVDIPSGNTSCGLSSFVELDPLVDAVQQKLNERNYGSLHYDHFINDPFMIGYWGSEGVTLNPLDTVTQLANSLLPPSGVELTFTTNRADFPPLAGTPPEYLFGPNVKVARVVYSEGWGQDGQGAALLYFAQDSCNGYYWHGLATSHEHFDK